MMMKEEEAKALGPLEFIDLDVHDLPGLTGPVVAAQVPTGFIVVGLPGGGPLFVPKVGTPQESFDFFISSLKFVPIVAKHQDANKSLMFSGPVHIAAVTEAGFIVVGLPGGAIFVPKNRG
jgi:hypothetical protein